jgi:hypothetical protein
MPGVPGGFRLLGGQQQQAQQMSANQLVVGCYLSLVPIVAQTILAQTDTYCNREEVPDRIADEAWKVTAAAMKKIGIQVAERPRQAAKAE